MALDGSLGRIPDLAMLHLDGPTIFPKDSPYVQKSAADAPGGGLTVYEAFHAALSSEEFRLTKMKWYIAEFHCTFITPRHPSTGEIVPRGYTPIFVTHQPETIELLGAHIGVEGGKRIATYLPPVGWILPVNGRLFSPDTGFFERTLNLEDREAAREAATRLWAGQVAEITAIAEGCDQSAYETASELVSMLLHRNDRKPTLANLTRVYTAQNKHELGPIRTRLYPVLFDGMMNQRTLELDVCNA